MPISKENKFVTFTPTYCKSTFKGLILNKILKLEKKKNF